MYKYQGLTYSLRELCRVANIDYYKVLRQKRKKKRKVLDILKDKGIIVEEVSLGKRNKTEKRIEDGLIIYTYCG